MKEAEDIIISKRFFELTPAELEQVKEFASNEEDYDAMRWFLQSTKTALAKDRIEAEPSLRKNVMAHLHAAPAQKTIWLNGAAAFLFPKEKRFYQQPAFQMAAVGLVLVGFVFMYDGTLDADNAGVAQNLEQDVIAGGDDQQGEAPAETVVAPGSFDQDEESLKQDELVVSNPAGVMPAQQVVTREEAENTNYKFSVAEEARFDDGVAGPGSGATVNEVPMDELTVMESDKDMMADDYRTDANKNSGNTIASKLLKNDGDKKSNVGRDEAPATETLNGTSGGSLITTGTTTTGYATTAPATTTIAGNITVTDVELAKEKEEKEGGLFLTATAGNVYGDTASFGTFSGDMSGGVKPDADAPASQFSVSDSKELKSLFFTVK